MKTQDLAAEEAKLARIKEVPPKMKELNLSTDSVTSVKGSVESVEDEETIKEKPEPDADAEDDDLETEFLEDEDMEDYTESSASVSELSANAPIRNKKVPFTLIRKILTIIAKPKNKVGASDAATSQDKSEGESSSKGSLSKSKKKRKAKVDPM